MRRSRRGERGQATTEVVLLFPLFMFFLFAFAKVFALLILVQKVEIASFYAGRRWQLESHRNANCEGWDSGALLMDINEKVKKYIGYDSAAYSQDWGNGNKTNASTSNFLDLTTSCLVTKECGAGAPGVTVSRTQVWNVVIVTACTKPLNMPFYKTKGFVFCSTKYVPNRDRPIAFILPGLQDGSAPKDKGCGSSQ